MATRNSHSGCSVMEARLQEFVDGPGGLVGAAIGAGSAVLLPVLQPRHSGASMLADRRCEARLSTMANQVSFPKRLIKEISSGVFPFTDKNSSFSTVPKRSALIKAAS
jgi:hypothetical protein